MMLLAVIGLLFSAPSASAQFRALKELMPAIAPAAPAARVRPAAGARAQGADDAADAMSDLSERKFPGGAALKTDPEQQRLLKRAEQCVADGRLDLAAVLWQRVLNEAGDTLMTRDGRTYTSLADEVERTLSASDPQALATYRITADGEAQAILAQAEPDKEEEALAKVVHKYFLSTIGDEAAYKLACYALDRHDFVGASRLLTRILERHPDPSMAKSEILLRLAVASAHVGDSATATAAMQAIGQIPGPRPEGSVLELVEQHLALASQSSTLASATSQNWLMMLGNASRSGRMPPLPAEATSRTLSELWVQEQEMQVAQSNTPNQYGVMGGAVFVGGRVRRQMPQNRTQAVSHDELVEQWREHKWTPTGMLLFDGGRVYFKTHENLQCFSASATSDRPVWESAWDNRYELDGMSGQVEMMMRSYGWQFALNNDKPRGLAEVHLFGDRVHHQLSIAGGMIYSIEGERVSKDGGSSAKTAEARPFQWGVQPRRTRSNFLAAYEARTGKAKWHRAASDEDKEGSQDVGFLCAPVPFGNLLVSAVTDGGTIWLYGLNAADGATVWKSYLCDEPANGCKAWSPVGIAVDGREAYVVCGAGVVFAVDAVSGTIRWAVRYERGEKGSSPQMQMWYGQQPRKDVTGWDDDVVIPVGRALAVMASDSDEIFALDRRSGGLLWRSPRTPNGLQEATYCLGVTGRGVIVAGKNAVRRYDVVTASGAPSGKLVWDREIGDSFGRGCLTDDAVYVPVKDSIVKLELEKGRELVQVGVALTTSDPVGNLFSDGEKLWVTGAGRVYAMTNLEHRLAILSQQIAAGDGDAQLNRMRLYAKAGQQELMLADLKGSYEHFRQKLSPDEAAEKFLSAVSELKLPQQQPAVVLDLLAEQYVAAASPPELTTAAARRADVLAGTLGVIRQKKIKGLAGKILALAPLCDKEYLSSIASQAILASAKVPDDIAALKAAAESENPLAQFVAAGPLGRLAPSDAKEPLTNLLTSSDDRVKLAAARGLADLGERTTLPVLVALLESENPRVRQYSHETLRALSSEQIAFASEAPLEERAKTVTQWKEWLAKDGEKAALKTPLPDLILRLGRTLVASQAQAMVVELDADFKVRSTIRVANPWGVWGLPNGNRLVAVYQQTKVVEYNEAGKEVWSKDGLPGPPYSVQRLENGNTLIACADVNQIVEVSTDGTTKTIAGPWNRNGRPVFARRLDNGHTLVALQNEQRVVEIDKSGSVVFDVRDMNGPSSCTRLENGNTLIVQMFNNQVIEVDAKGKKTSWSPKIPLQNPTDAQRLPSGNTLIADIMGLHEVDPAGQLVREHRLTNVSGISSY
ncbi:MAG TPA: PQQ-binding-like beta-propeller repeat protein [Pirellulaceae bacterium]|nr:PQQ-binding-like beta-propeller repeat protein [Pirellulaceae bacterium]